MAGHFQTARGRFVVVNSYFPKGSGPARDNSRVGYKLDFSRTVFARAQELRRRRPVLVIGDYNTAHRAIDLARPQANVTHSGFLPEERAELDRWVDAGWVDAFRARRRVADVRGHRPAEASPGAMTAPIAGPTMGRATRWVLRVGGVRVPRARRRGKGGLRISGAAGADDQILGGCKDEDRSMASRLQSTRLRNSLGNLTPNEVAKHRLEDRRRRHVSVANCLVTGPTSHRQRVYVCAT